jgi:hypothetical protein
VKGTAPSEAVKKLMSHDREGVVPFIEQTHKKHRSLAVAAQ